jgi:hypothetical protein
VCLGDEQNHEALPENTKGTIQKKLFLKVLSCICVFVFKSKKPQSKQSAAMYLKVIDIGGLD